MTINAGSVNILSNFPLLATFLCITCPDRPIFVGFKGGLKIYTFADHPVSLIKITGVLVDWQYLLTKVS
jgi:hypothetical protein